MRQLTFRRCGNGHYMHDDTLVAIDREGKNEWVVTAPTVNDMRTWITTRKTWYEARVDAINFIERAGGFS
jgi:hypothetical protein